MTLSNLPPPDELAKVREEIRRLEDREAELRRLLLTDESLRTGTDWIAEVKEIVTSRVDLKEMRAMHADLVGEYTFPLKTTRIELSGITDDGEIVSARKMRTQSAQTERQ